MESEQEKQLGDRCDGTVALSPHWEGGAYRPGRESESTVEPGLTLTTVFLSAPVGSSHQPGLTALEETQAPWALTHQSQPAQHVQMKVPSHVLYKAAVCLPG